MSLVDIPSFDFVPKEQRHSSVGDLRFDDLSQDGRVQLMSIVRVSQPVVWGHLGSHAGIRALWGQGVIPVLSRLLIETKSGSFTPVRPLAIDIAYQFAHVGSSDQIDRLMLLLAGNVRGSTGQFLAPASLETDQQLCGRFFAEIVFTKLFAPAAERKVIRFEVPGLPPIPAYRHAVIANDTILTLPEGAVALEAELTPDPSPIVFGPCHTDMNQHVSSFVYPRLFEEAVLRRLKGLGVSPLGLARTVEVGYRKPFAAGDVGRILLRTFRLGDRLGAVGSFIHQDDISSIKDSKARCYLRVSLEP